MLFVTNIGQGQNFWEPVSIPQSPWISRSVAVAPNGHVFALSDYYPKELFISTDDGISWYMVNNELDLRLPGIVLDHEGRMFGTTDTTFICSSDEGKTWSNLRDGSFRALTVGFHDELYMVTETWTQGDSLLISNDHGKTWIANAIDTSLHGVSAIAVNVAGDIFAASWPGLFRSTDGGQSWIETDSGIEYPYVKQLLCDKHGEVFAGSLYGGLYFSTDNGGSWSNNPWLEGTYDQVSFIALDSTGRIYAGSGAVWRSVNHGNTWNSIGGDFSPDPITMAISKSGHIFAGSGNGGICLSTNEGNSWSHVSWRANSPFPVTIGPKGEVLMGTSPDGLAISTDVGDSWMHSTIPDASGDGTSIEEGEIAIGLSGKIFVSTYEFVGPVLYESSDVGKSWVLLDPGLPRYGYYPCVFINKGIVYVGVNDIIVLSLDSGANWKKADSIGVNSIAGFASDSEGNIYVGGSYLYSYNYFGRWLSRNSVNIFKSSDSGKTWLQVASNLTNDTTGEISRFGLTIDDSTRTIFVATNEGIYRSINGNGWLRLDSLQGQVGRIIVTSPRHVFAYNSEGVFYSTDDGNSWTAINSGLKGLPSWNMSMAVNASGRLFIATDSGLFRSVKLLSSDKQTNSIPSSGLIRNFPNPFARTTSISFTLPSSSYLSLKLFDATGREISTLVSSYFDQGEHEIKFDRGDLPAGVYFYRLEANGESQTRAMVIEP